MKQPIRIQRKRTPGWKAPENTINVTRPGQYGNPFKIGGLGVPDAEHAVRFFENWLHTSPAGMLVARKAKNELKGKNLMCFCALDQHCHADILLKISNE